MVLSALDCISFHQHTFGMHFGQGKSFFRVGFHMMLLLTVLVKEPKTHCFETTLFQRPSPIKWVNWHITHDFRESQTKNVQIISRKGVKQAGNMNVKWRNVKRKTWWIWSSTTEADNSTWKIRTHDANWMLMAKQA